LDVGVRVEQLRGEREEKVRSAAGWERGVLKVAVGGSEGSVGAKVGVLIAVGFVPRCGGSGRRRGVGGRRGARPGVLRSVGIDIRDGIADGIGACNIRALFPAWPATAVDTRKPDRRNARSSQSSSGDSLTLFTVVGGGQIVGKGIERSNVGAKAGERKLLGVERGELLQGLGDVRLAQKGHSTRGGELADFGKNV